MPINTSIAPAAANGDADADVDADAPAPATPPAPPAGRHAVTYELECIRLRQRIVRRAGAHHDE
eukprot:6206548-Pleurochrysis_carterae.AAC.2